MKALLLIIALALTVTPSRGGVHPSLLLRPDDPYYCQLSPGNFTPTIYVIWSNSSGEARGVAFGAEISPHDAYTVVQATSPFNVTGNAGSGYFVDFGTCIQGSFTIMQFVLYPASQFGTPCSSFQLTPHASYGGIRYTDCDNVRHRADRSTGLLLNPVGSDGQCEEASVPRDPYPADRASNIPLSTSLEWSFDLPQCGVISGRDEKIYFGTTPNPPLLQEYWDGGPYPLQPLQPSTTYYWKIRTQAYGLSGTSPVWSFTTTAPVATEQTTWGAVKALYR